MAGMIKGNGATDKVEGDTLTLIGDRWIRIRAGAEYDSTELVDVRFDPA
jgi:hypothetical protein